MRPLPNDPISHIVDRAPLGVINAFARSSTHWAGYVRANALDYADMLTRCRMPLGGTDDRPDAFIDRLPNGTPHGELITNGACDCHIIVTYRFGVAVAWSMLTTCTRMRGHRGTPYMLASDIRDTRNGDAIVYVIDDVFHYVDPRGDADRRPLRGYIVDGVLAPKVINEWMGATRANSYRKPIIAHGELYDVLSTTALFDVSQS